jgi:predicted phage-related endonuclease
MAETQSKTGRFDRHGDRRQFIGGSDARIIMGQDEKALAGETG